jgi:hypothetical protein
MDLELPGCPSGMVRSSQQSATAETLAQAPQDRNRKGRPPEYRRIDLSFCALPRTCFRV